MAAGKTAILIVSTGTSCIHGAQTTVGALKAAVKERFAACELREAYTSLRIIQKLHTDYGIQVDTVEKALERAAEDGIQTLVVQPTHLTRGREYERLEQALKKHKQQFAQILTGQPLLAADADFEAVRKAILHRTAAYRDGKSMFCLIGHGWEADSVCAQMQKKLAETGNSNYFVGVLKGRPSLEEFRQVLQKKECLQRVVLLPFMVTAGHHAQKDIAGLQDGSWRRVLERDGYTVVCILEGLGQMPAVREIYLRHLQEALHPGRN